MSGSYVIELTQERNPYPLDWSCSNPRCDEAVPALEAEADRREGPVCPRCHHLLVQAPFMRAVARLPSKRETP